MYNIIKKYFLYCVAIIILIQLSTIIDYVFANFDYYYNKEKTSLIWAYLSYQEFHQNITISSDGIFTNPKVKESKNSSNKNIDVKYDAIIDDVQTAAFGISGFGFRYSEKVKNNDRYYDPDFKTDVKEYQISEYYNNIGIEYNKSYYKKYSLSNWYQFDTLWPDYGNIYSDYRGDIELTIKKISLFYNIPLGDKKDKIFQHVTLENLLRLDTNKFSGKGGFSVSTLLGLSLTEININNSYTLIPINQRIYYGDDWNFNSGNFKAISLLFGFPIMFGRILNKLEFNFLLTILGGIGIQKQQYYQGEVEVISVNPYIPLNTRFQFSWIAQYCFFGGFITIDGFLIPLQNMELICSKTTIEVYFGIKLF